jgi:2-polyprenyl-3-methyl-5-hydroxy-6-metoxy-1,4-benzoquinol methylase
MLTLSYLYYRCVASTTDGLPRDRLYEAYASQHAGLANRSAAALIYRRDIRPALPPQAAGPVLDIGCGQGELIRLMLADGYRAEGVDISPEQVALAQQAGIQSVQAGDYRSVLANRPGEYSAVTATDVLEHLADNEVMTTFDQVALALAAGGVFVARVPNAVSPFGGHIRYGDFTHQSWFTAGSIRQLAAAAGFSTVVVLACPPVAHGLPSAARAAVWKLVSGMCKTALAAETGALRGHIVTQNLTFIARKSA